MQKLEKFCKYFVLILFALMISFLSISSIFATSIIRINENVTFVKDSIVINVLSMAITILLGVVIKIYKDKLKCFSFIFSKWVLIVLTIVNALIMIIWILRTQLIPDIDQHMVMNIAADMLEGRFDEWLKGYNSYMYDYPFQNGIVLFYYFMSMIMGPNKYVGLQLINIPFFVLGELAIYNSVNILWNSKKKAFLTYVSLLLWTPFSMYITFVYGNVIGFSLAMLALMFSIYYVKFNKLSFAIIASILMGLSIVMKSNFIIFFIAMIIFFVINWIYTKRKKNWVACLISIFVALVCTQGTNLITERITGIKTPEGIPKMAWVTMGICDDEAFGWWNGYTLFVYNKHDGDGKAASEDARGYAIDRVKTFIQKPAYGLRFYTKKLWSVWINPTFQGITIQNTRGTKIELSPMIKSLFDENGRLGTVYTEIMDVVQTLIYVGTFMWIMCNCRKIKLYQLLFAILFIGGFLFEIIWEAKCQYTIVFFYLLIPYAIIGWNDFVDWLMEVIGSGREKIKNNN